MEGGVAGGEEGVEEGLALGNERVRGVGERQGRKERQSEEMAAEREGGKLQRSVKHSAWKTEQWEAKGMERLRGGKQEERGEEEILAMPALTPLRDLEPLVYHDSESELESENEEFGSSSNYSFYVRIRSYNIISHLPGPKRYGKNITTAVGAYRKIITNKIVEKIVCNTNKFISRIQGNFSRERYAKDTNDEEIWALIGLLLLSGTKRPAIFPFKKYGQMMEPYSKFSDEKIIPLKGRCSFKQYLPNKPSKYGIKTYGLCWSRTSYVVNIDINAGKQPEGPFQKIERLLPSISWSNITTDNWYTSYPLAVALLNNHKLTFAGALKKRTKKKYHLNLCQIAHNKCLAQFLVFKKCLPCIICS
ncbi:hypothetical protein LAZ67_7002484 [Cordylochernes scorpioides]|uniref:PiggyBac transposable element-derived protein domain-containing protein n=1 Tax=Cordylochernes scorpioides TaxID=51811 RepID=A0ABY6KNP5_9ARAC|nr:hypothetical protein LAZ67_7002484 [Cordylochernes scorpioides]